MSNDEVKHFLLIYDHHAGHLVETLEFGTDAAAAVESYQQVERKFRDSAWMDIVLVGSDSLDTIRITHANYFTAPSAALEDTLNRILAAAAATD
ncbi:hypothetical protein [Tessaracoccus palaemonis]|uniref:Uncharacterized protein n=1 Tax=Tessaracoccus palaemonis TaxID=2829499 RepID=A0ABX8SH94_9ACTN|nr:hypothetical protein [Tessaracoccus palaemonis]QXT62767.1 hypothetical protein KDB89_13690 [Tessaracoccus palaemonis]